MGYRERAGIGGEERERRERGGFGGSDVTVDGSLPERLWWS